MRMTASWFRSLDLPHTRLWRDSTAPESGLPSDCHPDCIIVLEAVRMSPGEIEPRTRRWKNASPCLTQKAPYKGLGADSEEKHEPAREIDTVPADSLKALDLDRPIREADLNSARLCMSESAHCVRRRPRCAQNAPHMCKISVILPESC